MGLPVKGCRRERMDVRTRVWRSQASSLELRRRSGVGADGEACEWLQ
jgi:hypothetical protein